MYETLFIFLQICSYRLTSLAIPDFDLLLVKLLYWFIVSKIILLFLQNQKVFIRPNKSILRFFWLRDLLEKTTLCINQFSVCRKVWKNWEPGQDWKSAAWLRWLSHWIQRALSVQGLLGLLGWTQTESV